MKLLVLALSLASALGFGYFLNTPTPAPTDCSSRGACYDNTWPATFCDVAESDCYPGMGAGNPPGSVVDDYGGTTWYPPGSVNDWDGCCYCRCSCDHASETNGFNPAQLDCYYGEDWQGSFGWEPP